MNLSGEPVQIYTGERIAQLVIMPVTQVLPVEVKELGQTQRGEGGFGSTGLTANAAQGGKNNLKKSGKRQRRNEPMQLVLASASPRRRELLGLITPDFEVCTADVEESGVSAESPKQLAEQLAQLKCRAVSGMMPQKDSDWLRHGGGCGR